jgi:hypothetical protein
VGSSSFAAVSRGYVIFGDIEGKLDVLRVECTKCDRKGRYSVAKLIEKYGRKQRLPFPRKGGRRRRLSRSKLDDLWEIIVGGNRPTRLAVA